MCRDSMTNACAIGKRGRNNAASGLRERRRKTAAATMRARIMHTRAY